MLGLGVLDYYEVVSGSMQSPTSTTKTLNPPSPETQSPQTLHKGKKPQKRKYHGACG